MSTTTGKIAVSSTTFQRERTAGFTLLEVLIALIIAGAGLAVLMRAGASGLTATRTATRYEEAVARARSHLEAALHSGALAPRDNQGDDGAGYHWRVRIVPVASAPPDATGASITLYAASVWITWQDGGKERDVRLDTQRVWAGER